MAIRLTPDEEQALSKFFDEHEVPRELMRLKRVLKGERNFSIREKKHG